VETLADEKNALANRIDRTPVLFALFFLLIFIAAVVAARNWYFTAKLFPLFAGIPGVVFAAIQIWRELTGWESRNAISGVQMDEAYDDTIATPVRRRRTIGFLVWIIGTALGVWLIGLPLALTVSLVAWTRLEGGESWLMAISMGAGILLVVWGVFTQLFGLAWPPGEIFFRLGASHPFR
jgi:hypothetical protein